MKPTQLYMIGNAHIDPVWLWQWQEGYHEVKASFRSALDRMQEYPEFTFVSSSAAFYAWVEECDPAMFEEIRQRVAEGRWHLAGGWWIQPDCNLPGGESFVRQGLYGQRYFKEKFGVIARTGYNVDSFGHAGSLPQILLKSGLENYVFMRPMPHEKSLPGRVFWWEADDGSRVLTHRLAFEYGTWGKDLERHITRVAAEIKAPVNALMCFYGVGNHGGGPTRENLDSILRLNREAGPDFPELIFSATDAFFDHIRAQNLPLPVVHDDLQHHASGCYAAHTGIKRWNRQSENLLMTAEKWAAVADRLFGQPYPKAALKHAWTNVLFNQFHDILAGTSLEAAYEDARDTYGEAKAIAGRALNAATQVIAWNVNIEPEPDSRPIVVFNPHAWPARVSVELEFGKVTPEDVLLDDQGRAVPVQCVQARATANGRHRLSFLADLPALGYATYRLQPRAAGTPGREEAPACEAGDHWADNGRLRLELDPDTGFIRSLRDHRHEVEVFLGPAARPVVIDDPSDTWSHNVFRFANAIGEFKARSVRRVEHGPVKTVLRVVSAYGASSLVQDFTLYRDLDRIDVRVEVDWHERHQLLKLRFPLNLNQMKVTGEIPYGHLEHFANGEEEPGHSWLDLSGIARDNLAMYGLSLLNDGKQSWDVEIRDIGLTVLRSPIYAHHIPAVPQPDGHYSYMDQGLQRFTYSLLPHAGLWEDSGTVQAAAEINQPPVALAATVHPGPLPQRDGFIDVRPGNIVVSVLKLAEDDDALILRAYESTRVATRALIRLPKWERVIDAAFAPSEIKTFRIPRDPAEAVSEVNLLEWAV